MLVLLLLVLFLSGKPFPLIFGAWESEKTQQPVEQQTPGGATQPDRSLWVVNSTPCAWDADDSRVFRGDGMLSAGATASASMCQIVDWGSHTVTWQVFARSPSLNVTVAFGLGRTFSSQASLWGGNFFRYAGCAEAQFDHDALLPLVPGSNGGVGVPSEITLTVTNPTGKRVRDVVAEFAIRLEDFGGICPGALTYDGSYPGPFWLWAVT